MEEDTKKCFRCRFLDRYYIKGEKRYMRTAFGWCCKKRAEVGIREGCERFAFRLPQANGNRRLYCYLSDILTELHELRCYFEEEAAGDEEENV